MNWKPCPTISGDSSNTIQKQRLFAAYSNQAQCALASHLSITLFLYHASTQKDCNGRGLLHLAIMHVNTYIIQAVINFYLMSINDADNNNFLPLHYAMGVTTTTIVIREQESIGLIVNHHLLQLVL